jgi:hypothetical protein
MRLRRLAGDLLRRDAEDADGDADDPAETGGEVTVEELIMPLSVA